MVNFPHFLKLMGRHLRPQVVQDRLPTREQLLKRNRPTNGKCPLCDEIETLDHLLVRCPVAVFLWLIIKEIVWWPDVPHSILDLTAVTRYGEKQSFEMVWIGAAAAMWSLWTTRNKLIFEGKVLKQPTDVVFRMTFFIQLWRPLRNSKLQGVFDWAIHEAKKHCRSFRRRRRNT